MSGSPVYVDGKLMGAIAYGWSFSKEALAGVTPSKACWRKATTAPSARRSIPGRQGPDWAPGQAAQPRRVSPFGPRAAPAAGSAAPGRIRDLRPALRELDEILRPFGLVSSARGRHRREETNGHAG